MASELVKDQIFTGSIYFAPGSTVTTAAGVIIDLSAATVKLPAPAVFQGDAGNGGTLGAVPAPPAGSGANKEFLCARGDWEQADPMTAAGDMIYGGVGGVATRLPRGADGQFLSLVGGVPAWVAAPAGSSGGGTGGGATASDVPSSIGGLAHRWNAQTLPAGALASWQEVAGYGSPLVPQNAAANIDGKSVLFAGGGRYTNGVSQSGSFAVWLAVMPTGSRSEGLLSFGSGTTDGWRMTVGADGSGTLTTPNVADYPLSGTPLAIGAWHSVAVNFHAGGGIDVWINGQQVSYAAGTPASVAMGSFAVAGTADATNALNGSMGEVLIYSAVLTADQIASLHGYFAGGGIYTS